MGKGKPVVIRSERWFYDICLPRLVSEAGSNSPLELATSVAHEAFVAQHDHIEALEEQLDAMSEVLSNIAKECPTCEKRLQRS